MIEIIATLGAMSLDGLQSITAAAQLALVDSRGVGFFLSAVAFSLAGRELLLAMRDRNAGDASRLWDEPAIGAQAYSADEGRSR
jgi:hypothetical protein